MAVLTSAPGLRVEIIVNDEPLTEYDNKDDESADAKRVTKYVEARSGQQFAVEISFEKAFPATHDLRYKVWVDGTKVEFSYRTKEELEAHKGVTIDGIVTKAEAGWALLPLQFQRLNIGKLTLNVYMYLAYVVQLNHAPPNHCMFSRTTSSHSATSQSNSGSVMDRKQTVKEIHTH
jgi:hypothetical protein